MLFRAVNQPYLHSEPFERNGKMRRQSRFPDPTLAAAHGDQAQLLLFRRHGDADVGHVLERFKLAPNSCFQHLALDLTQAGDIQDETHHSILQARSARAALRSEEHTSELQSLMRISYAVFCLTKKKNKL